MEVSKFIKFLLIMKNLDRVHGREETEISAQLGEKPQCEFSLLDVWLGTNYSACQVLFSGQFGGAEESGVKVFENRRF